MRPKDIVTGLREALQDLLVPELRAIATKVDENGKQIQVLTERLDRSTQTSDQRFLAILQEVKDLRQEMNERFLHVDQRFEALTSEMNERFAKVDERFLHVDQRFEALTREMNERFAKVDARFEALTKEMNERFAKVDERFLKVDERFAKVEQQIADLREDMASVNGKLDILISHIVDFKALTQVTVRLDMLEKRVDALAQRLQERPT
ncbi:MAG: hypothetical protein ACK4K2_05955 [Dehalococcoidia bacterium]